jgi:hypothetical protein
MEKTSRRNFGKLIAGAVATLPLVSSSSATAAGNTESSAQVKPLAKRDTQKKRSIRNHQDTPPPLLMEEGSLKVDLMDPSLESTEELPKTGNIHKWEFPGATGELYIVGVQIVSGAGQTLFFVNRDSADNDEKRSLLQILVHMETVSGSRKEVVVSTSGRFVTFTVPTSRHLRRKRLGPGGPTDPPEPGNGGRVRFRYFDDGTVEKGKLESVAVAIGPGAAHKVTRYNRDDLGDAITGTQVMVWFDEL